MQGKLLLLVFSSLLQYNNILFQIINCETWRKEERILQSIGWYTSSTTTTLAKGQFFWPMVKITIYVEYFNLSVSMVNRKGAVCGSRRQGMHLRQWWFNWWQCEAATSGIFGGRKDPCFVVKSSCENLCCSSLFVKLQTNISRGSSLRYNAPS